MATFERFEDIEAWQRGRRLVRSVYDMSGRGTFARDFALRDQARRAAISIVANIAEGFERGGTREFLQFLSMARGSAGELRAHLCLALDLGYLNDTEFRDFNEQCIHVSRMIARLMNYLRGTTIKGQKYLEPSRTEPASEGRNVETET
jgi:four helix bundle protein